MTRKSIPELDLRSYLSPDPAEKNAFIKALGDAFSDIGFFALGGHGIPMEELDECYDIAKEFFKQPSEMKLKYEQTGQNRQRGFVPFGVEHAKGNIAPDLKEFWQTGRTLEETHPKFSEFPRNVWPSEMPDFELRIDRLYRKMEQLSLTLLEAASIYLEKPPNWLPSMAADGNTILRIIHYPPLSPEADPQSVRAAAHEDINFITLLVGATAEGLEVQDHDGSWFPIQPLHEHLIVDTGDMIQSLTNGLFKATTHRVVNPKEATGDRYSMPLFVHPRNEIDITPHPDFVRKTGGVPKYASQDAGTYLMKRLQEIGLSQKK